MLIWKWNPEAFLSNILCTQGSGPLLITTMTLLLSFFATLESGINTKTTKPTKFTTLKGKAKVEFLEKFVDCKKKSRYFVWIWVE